MCPIQIGLIGCGGAKLQHAAPARALYTDPLFRDALQHASHPSRFDVVRVLSAKHGLVELDQELEPYDLWIGDLTPAAQARLAERVRSQLLAVKGFADATVTVLAGAAYVALVRRAWLGPQARVLAPLRGLEQGQQRHWYKEHREHDRAAPSSTASARAQLALCFDAPAAAAVAPSPEPAPVEASAPSEPAEVLDAARDCAVPGCIERGEEGRLCVTHEALALALHLTPSLEGGAFRAQDLALIRQAAEALAIHARRPWWRSGAICWTSVPCHDPARPGVRSHRCPELEVGSGLCLRHHLAAFRLQFHSQLRSGSGFSITEHEALSAEAKRFT